MITCLTLLYGHIHLPLFSFNKLIKQDLCLPGRKQKKNRADIRNYTYKETISPKPSRFHTQTNMHIN